MNLRITDVVKHLLIINVLFFIGSHIILGDSIYAGQGRNVLALYYPESIFFKPYQIATHFFMHSNLNHIFFNMFALLTFGPALETYFGEKKFLSYYLFTAAGAALLHTLVQYIEYHYIGNTGVINASAWGASGAIYGVLVAFALKFPNTQLGILFLPFRVAAKYFVLIMIAFDLVAGFGSFGTGIAHFAHLGGALFGYILIKYWERHSSQNRF